MAHRCGNTVDIALIDHLLQRAHLLHKNKAGIDSLRSLPHPSCCQKLLTVLMVTKVVVVDGVVATISESSPGNETDFFSANLGAVCWLPALGFWESEGREAC